VREVRDWMEQVEARDPAGVKPLAEPKDFIPYAYNAEGEHRPVQPEQAAGRAGRRPRRPDESEQARPRSPRELLESYPARHHADGRHHAEGAA
jgi:type IV pilus assembly protein PilP